MPLDLMSTGQVCEVLKRDRRTVGRYVESGRLPVVHKLPGETGANLFDPADVRKLAAELAEETRARIPDAEAV